MVRRVIYIVVYEGVWVQKKTRLLDRITSHVKGREKRSKERLLRKSIEGNSNLVSMVGERGGEILSTRSSLKFMACEFEGRCIFYLLNFSYRL